MTWRVIGIVALIVLLFYSAFLFNVPSANAVVVNTTLRPVSDISTNLWMGTGTANGTCSGLCDYIDEAVSDENTSYLNANGSAGATGTFGMAPVSTTGQTATSIVVHAVGRAGNVGLGYQPITISLTIAGTTYSAPTVTFDQVNYLDRTGTFTGTWTKSEVDAATVTIAKAVNGLQPAVRLTQVYADVTFQSPVHGQSASRVYANANNISPGSPIAATNTPVETSKDVPFRLRVGISPSDTDWTVSSWGAHNNMYKLQYAQLTAGSCSTQSTGWTDVSAGAGAIRWYDNASVANNATIGDLGSNDVIVGGKTRVPQTYRESNSFTNTSTITTSQVGVWDFSLVSSGQPAGLSFCFRIVNNDGSLLNAYTAYPEVMLTGDLGISVVDTNNNEIIASVVPFSSAVAATTQCTTSTATLGTAGQRIRVSNSLVKNGWNVSLAATHPMNMWESGSAYYDFNDSSGCSDGGDPDGWGGRLSVSPAAATITPSSGCTNTGVSKGSNSMFSEGTVDAITLMSATSGAARFCDWYMTGVSLSQQIPAQTPPGSYSLNMVLTVTAQ